MRKTHSTGLLFPLLHYIAVINLGHHDRLLMPWKYAMAHSNGCSKMHHLRLCVASYCEAVYSIVVLHNDRPAFSFRHGDSSLLLLPFDPRPVEITSATSASRT